MASELSLILNTFGIMLFFGTLAGVFSEKINIPRMIPMIVLGIILSFIKPEGLINFSDSSTKETTLVVAEIALLIVLFQEGMHLSLRRVKENIIPIIILAIVGTIFTATLTGFTIYSFSSNINELSVEYIFLGSLLMAAIVVPTDPAATFSILRSSGSKVKTNLETILGGESALNDVIAIMLVIIILLPQVENGNSFLIFSPIFILIAIWQLIGGILLGTIISIIALIFISRINRDNENAAISLACIFAIFAIAPIINVSYAIAALTGGIVLSNPHYVMMKRKYTDKFLTPFWNKLVYLVEIFAFTFVGTLFEIENFNRYFSIGIILSIIVIIIRILSVYITTGPLDFSHKTQDILSGKDRLFIALAGFKGLTTAVLGLLTYVNLTSAENLTPKDQQFSNIVLFGSLTLILISGTIQGLLLPIISKRMGVYEENQE